MSDESELQIRWKDDESFLTLRSSRSSLVARGRRDMASLIGPTSPVSARLSALRLRAEGGDRDAQYELGTALREGYLEPESRDNGLLVNYLKKSAELLPREEDTDAERELKLKARDALRKHRAELAEAERRLHAIKKDLTEAVWWLRKAADQKHLYALNDLGDRYLKGEGVDRNPSEALRSYSFAAADDLDHDQ